MVRKNKDKVILDERWIKVKYIWELPSPCIAYDSLGKSIGIWDQGIFNSISEGYSFDDEDSNNTKFYSEGLDELIGEITHYQLLPLPPKEK